MREKWLQFNNTDSHHSQYITAKNMFTPNAIAHYISHIPDIIHNNKKLIMTHEQYEIHALRIASTMKLSASPNL
jgi:hypothetical protein